MINVDEILDRIEKLYQRTEGTAVQIPPALQAREYAYLARDYIAAASVLEQEAPQRWLPIMQLTGHAIELSLKACLASTGVVPPSGHDLVELYRQAEKLGFELDAGQFAAIVHLRHFYFEDLATGTRYKSRYPARQSEGLGGAVPSNATFTSIVNALLDHATRRGAI